MNQQSEHHRPAPIPKSAPPKQGLYDPQFEHEACGVGFLVHVKGQKSHGIIADALRILLNLDHRGACGCEPNTGDGAGILIQTPHEFLAQAADAARVALPAPHQYGVGMVFVPKNLAERAGVKRAFEAVVGEEGQTVLGWRDIPTDNSTLGKGAIACEPHMMQVFIGRHPAITDDMAFERKLYVIRKVAEQRIRYGKGT
ncbi:MAG: glutamate synthase subunit alpha, partial [Verrucomicrobia bacterium]|nr:glutamate synthase subunit alpha [Verrucomicrobiota bacterium]